MHATSTQGLGDPEWPIRGCANADHIDHIDITSITRVRKRSKNNSYWNDERDRDEITPDHIDHIAKKRKEISAIETLTVTGAKGRAVRRQRSAA